LAAESLVRRNDPVGAQWLKDFMRDTKVRRDFRSRAIRALGKAGGKEQIAFLKEFLRDQDGFLKGNSLLALGCLQADLETFREFLDERDDFLRFCALAGAALAGHKEFLPQLREGLDSPDVYVRIACGWALAAHKQTEGISALEKAFATKDAMQMVMAGDALTHIAASDQM
jgi:HEAT repeat protein